MKSGQFHGTASLITHKMLLTAAHNIDLPPEKYSSYLFVLGASNPENQDESTRVTRRVKNHSNSNRDEYFV